MRPSTATDFRAGQRVSETIVRAVHHVARSIDARTVADFVEDEDHLRQPLNNEWCFPRLWVAR